MRINKFISHYGGYSRRKTDELILEGKVEVNGQKAKVGQDVDESNDLVLVNGEIIEQNSEKIYYALNKPTGVLSSAGDSRGRKTVTDFIPKNIRVYPVGRLDFDTQGLILLTNDGDIAYKLTHPKHHIPRTYELHVKGVAGPQIVKQMREGVLLEDGLTKPAEAFISSSKLDKLGHADTATTTIFLTIYEGRKRQIRRMCSALGLILKSLKRTAMGNIKLGNLQEGSYRPLNSKEVAYLHSL